MNRLKELRTQQDLSVRQLAAKAGVDPSAVSLLENDRRKAQLATLTKLAMALGVGPEELSSLQDTGAAERGRASQRTQAERKRQQSQTKTAPASTPRPTRRQRQPKAEFWVFDDEGTSYGPFPETKARTLQGKLSNAYCCHAATLSEAGEHYRRAIVAKARGQHPAGFQQQPSAKNPPENPPSKPAGARNGPDPHPYQPKP